MTDSQALFGFNKFHSTDQIFSWMFLSWICLLFSTLDWGYVFWRKTTEIKYHFHHIRASQVAQKQRIRLPMQETQEVQVWSLGQAGPLDEGMVAHSSVLAWKIPLTEEPGGLQSVRQDWATECVRVHAWVHTHTPSYQGFISMTHHGWCWPWSLDWDCAGVILIFIAYIHSLSDSNLPIEGSALQ